MARRKRKEAARPADAADRRGTREVSPWWAGLLIVVVTSVAYLPSLRNGFVWDDDTHLTNHVVLQEDGLRRVWTTTDALNYWPLAWTSYWLEHQLWGLNPVGYHAVNVLLHALNAVLLWRVLLRLHAPGALLVGLLFAVHPVNVESVAWISQRRNLLSMLFFLAALLAYLRSEDRGRAAPYVAAVALFLAAMLSKGAAVGLPVVLLLCAWWRRGSVTRKDALRSLPFFAVAAAMSCVELWFQQRVIGETIIRDDGLAARIAGMGWAVWFYLFKAVLPLGLTFVYPRWEIDSGDWLTYLPLAALAAVAVVCWRARHGWGRPALFALGCYLAMLAPVVGLFDTYFMRYSLVADHYQYLALPAVLALLVAGGNRLWSSRIVASRRAATVACVALAAVLACLTWRQTTVYRDVETLFLDTIAKNPDCWMAYTNLGVDQERRNHLPQAEANLERALQLNPNNPEARVACGLVYARRGRLDEAVTQYREALALLPNYPMAHNNLGLALAGREELQEAEKHFRLAVSQQPDFAAAHNNLGNLLVERKRFREAVEVFHEALAIDPKHSGTHNNLAVAYLRSKRYREASHHLVEALKFDPDNLDARRNLQRLNELAERGDADAPTSDSVPAPAREASSP